MPTRNTIRAGTMSIISGSLWLFAGLVYFLTILGDDGNGNGWQIYYGIFTATILVAGVLMILAMIGVSKRSGGLGALGMVGLIIVGAGVAFSIMAWAVPFWMGLQAAGLLLFGIAASRNGTAPKAFTAAIASGFPIGVLTFIALNAAEVGPVDDWGDHPVAWAISAVVGTVIVAIGLIGWGRWLRAEEPADIDATAIPA